MKRNLIMLLMAVGIALTASGANNFTISTVEGRPGEEVTVDVAFECDETAVVAELVIPLTDRQLTYVDSSCVLSEERSNGHQLSAAKTDAGLRVLIYSTSLKPFIGNSGKFFSFRLKLGKDPQTYPLTGSPIVGDTSGNQLETTVTAGAVTILSPELTLVTTSTDYGHIPIRNTYTKSISLKNSGNEPLNISNVVFSASEFSTSESIFTIAAGATKNITVTYAPVVRGAVSETVQFISDAINGVQKATLIADPFSVNELHVSKTSGNSDEEVTISLTMNNMEPIVGMQCSFTLPDQLVYVDGSFAASERASSHSAMASLDGNVLTVFLFSATNEAMTGDDGEIATFKVKLDGRNGTYYLRPTDVVLSNITVENMVSATSYGYVTIKSPILSCASSLDMGSNSVTETASSKFTLKNTGKIALNIDKVTFLSDGYSIADTLPISIDAGKSAEVTVEYLPSVRGSHSTTMNIYTNDPDNRMKSVAVSGEIFEPNYLSLDGNPTDNGYDLIFSLSNYTDIVAMQMQIEWTSGMSTSDTLLALTDRLSGLSGTVWEVSEGVYGLLIYSLNNKCVSGNEGEVFTLSFENSGNADPFASNVKVSNIMLSNAAGENMASHDSLEFTPYLLGDSNGDGAVTPADVTNTRNYFLGLKVATFVFINADVNKDGNITASDVPGTRNIYLNQSLLSTKNCGRLKIK